MQNAPSVRSQADIPLPATRKTLGLTDKDAAEALKRYGENRLPQIKQKSLFSRFLKNLGDPVIRILLGVLLLNLLFLVFGIGKGDKYETIGIAVSVLLATCISTLSEHRSEGAFRRLSSESEAASFRVKRSGRILSLPIELLTVGDVVLLSAGEMIPADGRILSGSITVNQAALTGESREVLKTAPKHQKQPMETNDPASPFTLFRGCTILLGECEMEILRVGGATFLGEISREVQVETRDSPLKLRLEKLARQISVIGYIASGLIAAAYLFNVFVIDSAFSMPLIRMRLMDTSFVVSALLHALTLALTVIVVAVPEGLPLMVAVVLSSNIKRMVHDHVLVRTSTGIETAGSMTMLFTDKTGTLTEGRLSVGELILGDGTALSGVSALHKHPRLAELYALSAVYNTSSSISVGKKRTEAIGGNGTELALLTSVLQASLPIPRGERSDYLPFDSTRKYSVATLSAKDSVKGLVKGAPEKLLPFVTAYIDPHGRVLPFESRASAFARALKSHAEKGERVLLIAVSEERPSCQRAESGHLPPLILLSAIILRDKVRKEARRAVSDLRQAGIHVVMVTGDNRDTATAIAEKCGILHSGVDTVLSGDELVHLSDVRLKELLPRLGVVARALPGDKSRLVALAQESGMVVGMTGDGINDAPALKKADIGFSMGSGTQVAKDAGDIVILDNNLASIARAVLFGRTIFSSIRKFITLQLTMNLSAMGVTMICPFLGIESPVTVVQMLWINLIMDTLGGLAFAGEAPMKRYMKEPPKKREEPIMNRYMVHQIVLLGGFTILLSLFFLTSPHVAAHFRETGEDLCLFTAFFAFFIFSSVFNCFNCRCDRLYLFSGIGENRTFLPIMLSVAAVQILFVYLGGSVLRTMPLGGEELLYTLLLSLLVFPAELIRKLLWRLGGHRKGF